MGQYADATLTVQGKKEMKEPDECAYWIQFLPGESMFVLH